MRCLLPCTASRSRAAPECASAARDRAAARGSAPRRARRALRASTAHGSARPGSSSCGPGNWSAGTTDWSCFNTSSCWAVSRHQPFGCERWATSCAGRLRQHPRLGAIASDAVVRQPPDTAVPRDLVELILLDLLSEVGPFLRPFRAFDHAAVHVGDVHRAVRPGRNVYRPKERIERADEFRSRIDVPQLRQSFGLDGPQAPDDPCDLLAVEVVAVEILGQPIAAIDLVAGRRGGVDQRAIRHPGAGQPGLDVTDADRRAPDEFETGLELVRRREVSVVHRELEIPGHSARAALEPHLPVVVLRHAPLRAVRTGRLLQQAMRRPSQPERIHRAVEPVVHPPEQARLLRLHVAGAAEARW